MSIRLESPRLVLRLPEIGDIPSISRHANDREVWLGLRDRFPHPYSVEDARAFVKEVEEEGEPERTFAIEFGGEVIGMAGIMLQDDVYRFSGEIGYWIGTAFRGRGLATEVVAALTLYGFDGLGLNRLWCHIFTTNPASARVVEKNGYALEGTMRDAAFKDGRFLEVLVYARLAGRKAR